MSAPLSYLVQTAISSSLQVTSTRSTASVLATSTITTVPSATGTLAGNVASPSPAIATATATATAAAAAGPPPVMGFPFLFHITIVIIVLFGIFFLSVLPRTIVRVSHTSGRFRGILLRSGGGSADVPPKLRTLDKMVSAEDDDEGETRTLNNPFEDGARAGLNATEPVIIGTLGSSASGDAPTRVRSLLSLTHPMFFAIVNYPVLPGLPVRKLAVLIIYLGLWLYGGLYRYNPFNRVPTRAGVVAVTQVPLVVFCVMKNNPISYLTGVAYEKLNYIHRFAGRLIFIAANAHALGWFFSWNPQGSAKLMEEFSTSPVRWGVVSLVCVDLLFVGSLSFVRRRFYGLFLATHVTGFIVLVVAFHQHYPATLPYLIAAFTLYGFDHVLRALRTRRTTAYIVAHSTLNGGSTQLIMPGLTTGWRAGQHVRMRVVSPEYPSWFSAVLAAVVSRVRAHPYSIANRPGADGLELIIKKAGRSTARLYALAGGEEKALNEKIPADGDVEAARELRQVQVLVEGPYSGPHTLFESYSGVVLVAGGSGITFVLSLLDDLLAKHAAGRSRLQVLEIVWSVSDYGSLVTLLPTLQALLRLRESPHGRLSLRIRVHYTRASRPGARPPPEDLPRGLALLSGRPNYARIVEETCDTVAATGGTSGVAVTHCGPLELGDQITHAVGQLSWSKWAAVRGVEVHGETFGW